MAIKAFSNILNDLAPLLGIPELTLDEKNACVIEFNKEIKIQLEILKDHSGLLIATKIGTVPPGKFRENLFKEALKVNNIPPPRKGVFAFSKKNDLLILYDKVFLKNLQIDQLAKKIIKMQETAKVWKDALEKGEVPVVAGIEIPKSSGMFGLR
ncbi:Tir chaperone protein (CesT) [Candidatus Rubidus massiliensis]|nr:Tir chaperone protein (CesT) [Candidatus Rubidus massiliensis]